MALLSEVDTTNWHHGTGVIVYDPERVTNSSDLSKKLVVDPRTETIKSKTDWWVTVNVDEGITDYYRWWANKHINPLRYTMEDQSSRHWLSLRDKREDLLPPMWGPHMSIVRGEVPDESVQHLWKKYDGQIVNFKYSGEVRYSGDRPIMRDGQPISVDASKIGVYWFVDAVCDVGTNIRRELGFLHDWTFHITVGRTRAGQNFRYVPPHKSLMT